MKMTMKLRWVEMKRGQVAGGEDAPGRFGPNNLTLQQWWEEERNPDVNWIQPPSGEWRDVPIENA